MPTFLPDTNILVHAESLSDPTEREIAEFRAGREAREAELNHRGEAMAARHGYDVKAIGFQLSRYQFGSLSNNWEAADMRSVLYKAHEIAIKRRDAMAIAAE